MKYMALIYGDESLGANMTEAEQQQEYMEYTVFGEKAGERALAGDALHPIATAKTVRVRDGKMLVTDGPFAETKESLGGYYILDCANLDDALELAAMIPGAKRGSVEVRPIYVFE